MERPDLGGLDVSAAARRGAAVAVGSIAFVVALAAAVMASQSGAEAFARVRDAADPAGLVVAIALITLAQWTVAMRWRALLPPGHGLGAVWMTGAISVGLVFNYALPGPVGELLAALLVSRRAKLGFAPSFAALAASRVLGVGSACLLAVAMAPWVATTGPARAVVVPASVVLLLGGGGLGALAVRPDLILAVLARFEPKGRLLGKVHRAATDLATALLGVVGRGWWAWARALGWAIAGHFAVSAGLAVAAWSIGATPSLPGVLFTYAVATAGALLLYVFPGSQVGWDVSFAALLVATTGVPAEEAAVVTVIGRVQQTVMLLIGVVITLPLVRELMAERDPPA